MLITPGQDDPVLVYRHLVNAVVPRPIGWISTRSTAGVDNVAPYSFFQAVSAKPAAVMFSSSQPRDGRVKDTLTNVRETGVFCVNIVSRHLSVQMNQTAAMIEAGESEFELAGLESEPAKTIEVPRVKAARVHLECRFHQEVQLGEGPMSSTVVFGLIELMEIHDSLLGEDGFIDPKELNAIGRMGGNSYCRADDVFELDRPG